MNNTEHKAERYLLLAVACDDEEKAWASLEELAELLETAGGEATEGIVQRLPHPDTATYVGSGKAQKLCDLLDAYDADGILCDDELSAVQIRNLSDITGVKVIDRTILILDIFAAHARTREGKIQVEMAQLKYRQAHLRGIGTALSRLGGGIGTRGPGETKLETDRRAHSGFRLPIEFCSLSLLRFHSLRRYAGTKRVFIASMKRAPFFSATSAIIRMSSAQSAAGFSQRTAFFASSALIAHSLWSPCGSAR